jgi:hypothetical protein
VQQSEFALYFYIFYSLCTAAFTPSSIGRGNIEPGKFNMMYDCMALL